MTYVYTQTFVYICLFDILMLITEEKKKKVKSKRLKCLEGEEIGTWLNGWPFSIS